MKRLCVFFLIISLSVFARASAGALKKHGPVLKKEQFETVSLIARKAIRAGQIPGAVVLIGNRDRIIYNRSFGHRQLRPTKLPMSSSTIFDMASVTKVVATTTAIMQLFDEGRLDLEDPASRYWPGFSVNGKEEITVRELLTHYSGLRPALNLHNGWSGYEAALEQIIAEKPVAPPGSRFIYSDINFIVLGEIVRKVSGMPLDRYCAEHIFGPLGMKNTMFSPSPALRSRIAPTVSLKRNLLKGEVHDPTARSMGGVAGHAGLFSTAEDLATFAQMLLRAGSLRGRRVLSAHAADAITLPQSPHDKTPLRGLGWNIAPPLSANKDELFPAGSYNHKGYTGTGIWIDPVSKTYVIILTNRVHPDGKGDADPLRDRVLALVSSTLGHVSQEKVTAERPSLSAHYLPSGKDRSQYGRNLRVKTGLDALEAGNFSQLAGLRIGLITNHTGLDCSGRRTIDILYDAPGIKLVAIFSPEHGLSGKEDSRVPSASDPFTLLPVYSLYGDNLRPSEEMLGGIDALVFDIQDAGVSFYTYITTMGYAMEAAAQKGIEFYVLDRPDPVTGSIVQGPVPESDLRSFTDYFPMPIRHGMTVGELAKMFNEENRIGAKLRVIRMEGYRRDLWYDDTGLKWVNPSPNLRSLTEATLYPGVALAEGANVSVGRGTETPFEILGAPWINSGEFASYLGGRKIPGINFMPADFIPEGSRFKNRTCHGVRIILTDRQVLDSPALGIEIISALQRLYPGEFEIDQTLPLIGSRKVLQRIKDGADPREIVQSWQGPLEQFLKIRAKYLLY